MNDRRPCKTWHVTIKGHYLFNIPTFGTQGEYFYCFEEGNLHETPHTHIGLHYPGDKKDEPGICKRELIRYIKEENPGIDVGEPDCKTHNRFDTVIGYHYGAGDKDPCAQAPVWPDKELEGKPFVYREYLKGKSIYLRPGTKARGQFVENTLSQPAIETIRDGNCSAFMLPQLEKSISIYNEIKYNDAKLAYPDMAPIPDHWGFDYFLRGGEGRLKKKRHLWVKGCGNAGKTWFRKVMCSFKFVDRAYYTHPFFHGIRPDTEIIMWDEFVSGVPNHLLNDLCDGDTAVRMLNKFMPFKKESHLVIILSNYSIDEIYTNPVHSQLLKLRFDEVEVNQPYLE